MDYVKESISTKGTNKLVDVRSPKEFTGEILAPPEYPTEHAQRGWHIPGALNIPWAQAVNDADGTFKTADQLKELYESMDNTRFPIISYMVCPQIFTWVSKCKEL